MTTHVVLPAVSDLLPHRGIMLLLDRLLAVDAEHACALVEPSCQTWYADGHGPMPAWIGIELMAQTIAAHVGWKKANEGCPPKQGVLLGTRTYRCEVSHFDKPLTVQAHLSFMDESGLGAYDCSIAAEGKTLATATVKVFEPENFEEFVN